MTAKGRLQSRQQRETLLAQCGQIATNATKILGTREATKTARDLLLHFDHPKIPLREVVVKIHTQIMQEAEERFLVFLQAINKVASGSLFAFSSCSGRSRCPWMSQISLFKKSKKLRFPISNFQGIKPVPCLLTRLLCRLFHLQEQVLESMLWWYRLSRQKWTNIERELSSMRKE